MSDEAECPECKPGAPAWLGTFADLMSLLMCFFVLLLSFSEIQAKKYKQIVGSMKEAFGVQREVHASENPKGTSIIAQEFSPGKPQPTPLDSVRQFTTQEIKQNLDFTDSSEKSKEEQGGMPTESEITAQEQLAPDARVEVVEKTRQQIEDEKRAEQIVEDLSEALKEEIEQGLIDVKAHKDKVIIRVQEKGSFSSGRANIKIDFVPTLDKISRIMAGVEGNIIVAGHTDNLPISTQQFPSNWELSAARSATFVHFMKRRGNIEPARLEIRAHADVLPIADNGTVEGRALNRRVEIMLLPPGVSDSIDASQATIETISGESP